MQIQALCHNSWEYTTQTRVYRTGEKLAIKVLDIICPKNELTGHRIFKFIPTFVVETLGYLTYQVTCYSYLGPDREYKKLVDDVNEVFDRLVSAMNKQCPSTKRLAWEIRIKRDSSVNAFCCPGGKVMITTGILESLKGQVSDKVTYKDLIASVLGHEITHAVAEHSHQSMQFSLVAKLAIKCASVALGIFLFPTPSDADKKRRKEAEKNREFFQTCFETVVELPCNLLLNRHSRSHEFEADKYGIKVAYAAKFNPKASIKLQKMFLRMKGESAYQNRSWFNRASDLFSTHPPSHERLKANKKIVAELLKAA